MNWQTTIALCLTVVLVVVKSTYGSLKINATCDDKLFLYANGQLQISNEDTYDVSSITVTTCPEVVAIKCIDSGGIGGLLASMSNEKGTYASDNSWKCITGAEPSGWKDANYDDSTWPAANEINDNLWADKSFPGISADAKWIWTDGLLMDKTVYCRKSIECAEAPTTTTNAPTTVEKTTTAAPIYTTEAEPTSEPMPSSGYRISHVTSVLMMSSIFALMRLIH